MEKLSIHKAAKKAFYECGLKKISSVKELNAEYAALFSAKQKAYEYQLIRDDAQGPAITERKYLCVE